MSPRRDGRARTAPAPAAQVVGVNLMPPSVHASRDLRRLRVRLALVLVLVAALVAGGYGYLTTLTAAAQDRLTTAEAEGARLEAERIQHVEIEQVRAEHRRADQARTAGMGPEVRWTEMLARIEMVIAQDTTITSFSGAGPSAVDGVRRVTDPLTPDGIGTITFSIRTPTLPDTAAWLDSLNGIVGFRGASFSSATLDQSRDGPASYTVSSTVQLDLAALSQAFLVLPDETTPDDTQEAAG